MGTMTISISDETEGLFRRRVSKKLGQGKGKLGQAVEEAVKKWSEEEKQIETKNNLLNILKKGYNLGGITYKKRAELYDR